MSKYELQPLSEWLKKFRNKAGSGLPFTHSFLTGGVYNIEKLDAFLKVKATKNRPQRSLENLSEAEKTARIQKQELAFIRHYALSTWDILTRKKRIQHLDRKYQHLNFVSEKITPVFKYFIDLDFFTPETVPMEGFSSEKQMTRHLKHRDLRRVELEKLPTSGPKVKLQERTSVYQDGFKALNHQRLLELVRFLQDNMREFYPGFIRKHPKALAVLVCLTTPKKFDGKEKKGYGEGVHLVFPYLEVNSEQALNLRQNLVYRLETSSEFGNRPAGNSWPKVFDEGVYNERGGALRMLGSRKAESCECQKKIRSARKKDPNVSKNIDYDIHCKECRHGKKWTSRIYWPEYFLDTDGQLLTDELNLLLDGNIMIQPENPAKPMRKDYLYRLMKMASLRTSSTAPNSDFRMPIGAVRHVPFKPATKSAGRKRAGGLLNPEDRLHDEDLKTLSNTRAEKRPFAKDHPFFPLIQMLIPRKFGECYKNISIPQMFLLTTIHPKRGRQQSIMIFVGGPGSSFCLNKNADHTSNTIYFMLDEWGIYQKCHCKCDVKRNSGIECKKYASERKTLADVPTLLYTLFPPMYHGVPYHADDGRKWGKMQPGFTVILWNRLVRSNPNPDGPIEGIKSLDITQADDSVTPQLINKIKEEINFAKNTAAKEPEPQKTDAELDGHFQQPVLGVPPPQTENIL